MDSTQCFLGTYEGTLVGWEVSANSSTEPLHTCGIKAHDAAMRSCCTLRRAGHEVLLTAASDGSIRVFDISTKREVGSLLVDGGAATCVSPCGADHVVTGHDDGFIRLWRVNDWSDVLTFRAHRYVAFYA